MFLRIRDLSIVLAGLTLAALSHAQQTTDQQVKEQIESAVKSALAKEVQAYAHSLGSSDFTVALADLPNMKLKPCQQTPTVSAIGSSKITTKLTRRVSCRNPQWSSNIRAEVGIYKPVVVATQTIARNNPVYRGTLRAERKNILTLHSRYFSRIDDIVGQISRRQIYAGRVIQPSMVTKPELVNRNAMVTIEAAENGFRVSMTGKALDSGSLGEQVQIRNLSSGKVITGVVTGRDTVRISIP